jgi:glycosyltransferase involved in cell wall biosynthesis
MHVALAHDSVTAYGGAERTLEMLFACFPCAPLFTAIFKPAVPLAHVGPRLVRTSFLQPAPLPARALKLLFPLAFARFRPPANTELIVSSSSGYAKALQHPGAVHVAYVHTPLRRLWNAHHIAANRHRLRGPLRVAEAIALALLRRWDLASMGRVDHVVANSENTALQIRRIYGRDATVIHPPVRTSFFVPSRQGTAGEYFVVATRLDPYKRVDLAIHAANMLGFRLLIIGDGVEGPRLRRLAGPSVTFIGVVDDSTLCRLYQGCRALIFPGEEDFGIVLVEAQSCGRPVVAYSAGGALETVVDGVTGVFFTEQKTGSLVQAIERLQHLRFDPQRLREHALQFDDVIFRDRLSVFIKNVTGDTPCH